MNTPGPHKPGVLVLWMPVLAYMMLIYLVSSCALDFLFLRKAQKIHADWLAHIVEYSVLGFLLMRALAASVRGGVLWGAAITLGILYGVSDEFHQQFVPNRDASLFDAAADAAGVVLGAWLWTRQRTGSNA